MEELNINQEEIKQPLPTKKCKACGEEKTFDQYYKSRGYPVSKCKRCHNKYCAAKQKEKYPPIVRKQGFNSLPDETKRKIIDGIAAGVKIRVIADSNGVSVDQVRAWRSRGKLVMPAAN